MPKLVKVTRAKLYNQAGDIVDMVVRKNHDYGDAWQLKGRVGALIRLLDKGLRFINLTSNTTVMVTDESVRDTLCDLVGYSLLLLLHFEEAPDESQDPEIAKAQLADVLRAVSGKD